MSSVLSQIFVNEIITFLIMFVAIPYTYLSHAAQVQKECIELIKSAKDVGQKRRKLILRTVREESYVFDVDWWIVAATALLISCVYLSGAFLSQSIQFCAESTNIFALRCEDVTKGSRDHMNQIFGTFTLMVGLALAFRIWWARLAFSRKIRELQVSLLA